VGVTLTQTIPALPVRDAVQAVASYRDKLGFDVVQDSFLNWWSEQ
jgi:catechol 2,3-dioxygenase-like lactoylglutathione lyase family enzyme